ncbi:MAG: RnfABCDGE type electron transport complex subunit G [Desulfosarcinaceae bacterium]|nr:RnfABCDGE type electron transport complex subunit G [Desulfosarcinaceae bacterium]
MVDMIKMVVVLTILSSFSGGVLATLRDNTSERIENQELNLVKGPAVRQILEGASNDPVADRVKMTVGEEEKTLFIGVFDGNANTVAFETTGKGYADKFGLVVAVNTDDDTLVGIGVTTHKETPGLGAVAKDDPTWAAQFKGLPISEPVAITNDGGSVNAISGATITSRAVCDAATDALKLYSDIKPQLLEQIKAVGK